MAKTQRYFVTRNDRKVEHLPWGPHHWLSRPDIVDTRDLLVVRVNMPKGKAQEFHRQPGMEEVIYILEGRAEQWVEKEMQILGVGDMAHVPRNAAHATVNVGGGVLRFLSIFSPAVSRDPAWVDCSAEEPWVSLREQRGRDDAETGVRKRGTARVTAKVVRKKSKSKAGREGAGRGDTGKVVRKAGRAAKTTRRKRK